MRLKKLTICSILFLLCSNIFAQQLHEGQLRWSSTRKLVESDFKIKVSSIKNTPIFSQFTIGHTIGGLDFFRKNFNQKIDNIFLGDASWIENTGNYNIEELIAYQQIQFDIAEITARKFRKKILENKSKIANGIDFVNKMSQDIMTEFSKQRLLLEKETESGTNKEILKQWQEKVALELLELDEF